MRLRLNMADKLIASMSALLASMVLVTATAGPILAA